MSQLHEIIASLDPLFTEAVQKGYWFYNERNDLWFSPRELRVYQAHDKFLWGAPNWKLRDPKERLRELQNQKLDIEERIQDFKIRMG